MAYLTEFFIVISYKEKYRGFLDYKYNQELLTKNIIAIIKNQIKENKKSKLNLEKFEELID